MLNKLPPLKQVPSPNFSNRTSPVDLVVIHDCEGSYLGSIAWFRQIISRVSAQIVVRKDGLEATQMVGLDKKAWHVCNLNSRATGVEIEGFAKDGFGDAELDAAANICAWLLRYHGLPCVWAGDGAPGKKGLTSHYALGQAGGGHSDPSTDPAFPGQFMARVKPYYDAYASAPLPVWALGGHPAPQLVVAPPKMPSNFTPTTAPRTDSDVEIPGWPSNKWYPEFYKHGAQIFMKWRSYGVGDFGAYAALANAERETGLRLGLVGDNGTAFGLWQWRGDRITTILNDGHIDIKTADYNEQCDACYWELKTKFPALLVKLKAAVSPGDAARFFCAEYELAGAKDAVERSALMADRWVRWFTNNPPS